MSISFEKDTKKLWKSQNWSKLKEQSVVLIQNIIIADLANIFPLMVTNMHLPPGVHLAKTAISFKAEYQKLKRMQNFFISKRIETIRQPVRLR